MDKTKDNNEAVGFHPVKSDEVRKKFREYFGLDFADYMEPFRPTCMRITVDLFKLDDYFMEEYKYEGSMREFVKKQFGAEAEAFLKKLL